MAESARHHHEWWGVSRIVQQCGCGAEREWDGFEWWMVRAPITSPEEETGQ